jgi:hypothetical protein
MYCYAQGALGVAGRDCQVCKKTRGLLMVYSYTWCCRKCLMIGNICTLPSQGVSFQEQFHHHSNPGGTCLFYFTSGACSSCCSYLLQGPLAERASHFQGQHHPCIQENNHLSPTCPFELPNASTQPHPKTSCPEWSRLHRELIAIMSHGPCKADMERNMFDDALRGP